MSQDAVAVKREHASFLLSFPPVTALGVGPRKSGDSIEMVVLVFVGSEEDRGHLIDDKSFPDALDDVPVEVRVQEASRKRNG